jgi:hypothetical protein
MRGKFLRLWAMLALLAGVLAVPGPTVAATDPGVSVAPQAGAPGTQFELIGAGWAQHSTVSVLIERDHQAGRTIEVTTDAGGRFALTLDSTGYEENPNYTATVSPKGGTRSVATNFAVASKQDERCFMAETGFCVRGRVLAYWQAHGELAVNGYPIGAEINEILEDGKPYVVQYFERTRLEYHPESTDQGYTVLIGQFGRRIRPADPPVDPDPMQTWFPQTGHNVPTDFYSYWTDNGGLDQFGLPLSEAFQQQLEDGKTYRVQYFERARFESHPENAPPYQLLLGQFGRLILRQAQR